MMDGKHHTRYIPVEAMSTRQYLDGINRGMWGGVADPKILERIKDNKDNYWLMEEDEPTPENI